MAHSNRDARVLLAGLDIGTSSLKIGVYGPLPQPHFTLLGRRCNQVYGREQGRSLCNLKEMLTHAGELLTLLARHAKKVKAKQIFLTICGHVSSVIAHMDDGSHEKTFFPIWADKQPAAILKEVADFFETNPPARLFGCDLPLSPSWLISKLKWAAPPPSSRVKYLQAADCVFQKMTGHFLSHPSSQISLVHQFHPTYVPEILKFTGLKKEHLPALSNHGLQPMREEMASRLSFSCPVHLLPARADFYSTFCGLGLNKGEGFLLANTSEIAGKVIESRPKNAGKGFVQTCIEGKTILYGSTNSGSNLLNWSDQVFGANTFDKDQDDQTCWPPDQTPLFLPYVFGERAPLWKHDLDGSFTGLRPSHGLSHMTQAILEGVAMARRDCFEQMGGPLPDTIKIAGGGSKYEKWNQIRADVLGRPLLVFPSHELGIWGGIREMAGLLPEARQWYETMETFLPFRTIRPNQEMAALYQKKYQQFKLFQKKIYG